MRLLPPLCLLLLLLAACAPAAILVTPKPVAAAPSSTPIPAPSFTPIPSLTPVPAPSETPPASLGSIALDFSALLCNATWMNGVQYLEACPGANADQSGGYATLLDPLSEGLPANTPVLLMIPNANALFLRYPSFTVGANDRFRATLRCRAASPCDLQFALEYYDGHGEFQGPFMSWDYNSGIAPIQVDASLNALADQSVDFVLVVRLFHQIASPQEDNGLWIAPYIFRPMN
jgi:hypothetical protein